MNLNLTFVAPGGIVTPLTITFVVLKALGYLDWSWWWVFSPLWILGALVLSILLMVGLILLVAWWWDWSER